MRRSYFKWHRGTINDAKLVDVAKKAKAKRCEVYALWAYILEMALDSFSPGDIREINVDVIDDILDFKPGRARKIIECMEDARLIVDGMIRAWRKRQHIGGGKDATISDRMKRYRLRQQAQKLTQEMTGVTPAKKEDPTKKILNGELPPGFRMFWALYPSVANKCDIKTCVEYWHRGGLEAISDQVCGCLEYYTHQMQWKRSEGQFVPKPLVWLMRTPWIEVGWSDWLEQYRKRQRQNKVVLTNVMKARDRNIDEPEEVRESILRLSQMEVERIRAKLMSESLSAIDRKKWEFADVQENAFFRIEIHRVLSEEASLVNAEVSDG